jgi:hypothetical protein
LITEYTIAGACSRYRCDTGIPIVLLTFLHIPLGRYQKPSISKLEK